MEALAVVALVSARKQQVVQQFLEKVALEEMGTLIQLLEPVVVVALVLRALPAILVHQTEELALHYQ
jgi:hypothetical protein